MVRGENGGINENNWFMEAECFLIGNRESIDFVSQCPIGACWAYTSRPVVRSIGYARRTEISPVLVR